MQVLVIGCGDIGQRIAARHIARGDQVTGLVRREILANEIRKAGITPLLADLDQLHAMPAIAKYAVVYLLIPPPSTGRHDPRTENLLGKLGDKPPDHLVYISSTAVYGDRQAQVVTEETQPAPVSDRGIRRLAAENAIMKFAQEYNCPVTILRVAAIYGPGRLPVKKLEQGLPVLEPEASGPGNRIHADDLALLCFTAACVPRGQRIYNVADNNPLPQADYLDLLADLLHLPRPRRMDWNEAKRTLTEKQLEFLSERRLVDATRILRELGINLEYAEIARGLRASLAGKTQ